MARRFSTSRFSASWNEIFSMYGNWLPSVSTQMLYGFRSNVQCGVLIGVATFQGVITGRSVLSCHLFRSLNMLTQLSKPASLAFVSTSACDEYLGRNCFR